MSKRNLPNTTQEPAVEEIQPWLPTYPSTAGHKHEQALYANPVFDQSGESHSGEAPCVIYNNDSPRGGKDNPLFQHQNTPQDYNIPEYYHPVSTHKKYLRGEKLYFTKDKREVIHRWKRVILSGVIAVLIVVVILVTVLAVTGHMIHKKKEEPTIPSKKLPVINNSLNPTETQDFHLSTTTREFSEEDSTAIIGSSTKRIHLPTEPSIPSTPYNNSISTDFTIINQEFENGLSDSTTEIYKTLARELQEQINEIFRASEFSAFYNDSAIISFLPGSIHVDIVLFWKKTFKKEDIETILLSYLDNHNDFIGVYKILRNSSANNALLNVSTSSPMAETMESVTFSNQEPITHVTPHKDVWVELLINDTTTLGSEWNYSQSTPSSTSYEDSLTQENETSVLQDIITSTVPTSSKSPELMDKIIPDANKTDAILRNDTVTDASLGVNYDNRTHRIDSKLMLFPNNTFENNGENSMDIQNESISTEMSIITTVPPSKASSPTNVTLLIETAMIMTTMETTPKSTSHNGTTLIYLISEEIDTSTWWSDLPGEKECGEGSFYCDQNMTCLPLNRKCNGIVDCIDKTDENECEIYCEKNFRCDSLECIPGSLKCDSINDCTDGSDEKDCSCPIESSITCVDGICVNKSQKCDGHFDCFNKGDEINCTTGNDCDSLGMMFCPEGFCLPKAYMCDGVKDCILGEDEDEQNCICSPDQHKCLGGGCIFKENLCNGIYDCPDKSDEWGCISFNNISEMVMINHYNYSWLPVCVDGWNKAWSDAFCRHLGFSGASNDDPVSFETNGAFFLNLTLRMGHMDNILSHLSVSNASECEMQNYLSLTCNGYDCSEITEDPSNETFEANMAFVFNINSAGVCLGFILSPMWILVSSSCLKKDNESIDLNTLEVIVGSGLKLTDSPWQQKFKVQRILFHHRNNKIGFLWDNDIALLKMALPLQFDEKVQAICLPDDEPDHTDHCTVVSVSQSGSLIHMENKWKVMGYSACNYPGHYNGFLPPSVVCVVKNKDILHCEVPHSAILFCKSEKTLLWQAIGFLLHKRPCGSSSYQPEVFSSIHHAHEWINNSTNQYLSNWKMSSPDYYESEEDSNETRFNETGDSNQTSNITHNKHLEILELDFNLTLANNWTYDNFTSQIEILPEPQYFFNLSATNGIPFDDNITSEELLENGLLYTKYRDPFFVAPTESTINFSDSLQILSIAPATSELALLDSSVMTENTLITEKIKLQEISIEGVNETDTRCHHFVCPDGTCIPRDHVCNLLWDCVDGFDEMNCDSWTCHADEFRCLTGRCIPLSLHCNGIANCFNHTDESNCTIKNCAATHFLCPEGWCIPNSWLCDGQSDCHLGADEEKCSCSPEEFLSPAGGGCVLESAICDGKFDTPDFNDESVCLRLTETNNLELRSTDQIWLPICRDSWTPAWSTVACQELGYGSVFETRYNNLTADVTFKLMPQYLRRYHNLIQGVTTHALASSCKTKEYVHLQCQPQVCGNWSYNNSDLVSVNKARDGQWPSVVLVFHVSTHQLCAASILSPTWLLTSLFCIKKSDPQIAAVHQWVIAAGGTSPIIGNKNTQIRNIKHFIQHPSAKFQQFRFDSDLVMIELLTPLIFNDLVQPVCLPNFSRPIGPCVSVGWDYNGALDYNVHLKVTPATIFNWTTCNDEQHYNGFLSNQMLCIDTNNTCFNGGGAPLMCINSDGFWEIYGVLSIQPSCRTTIHHAAIYVNTKSMMGWIENILYRFISS